jgi:tetratricopeptide (TPR) repeat protein
MNKNSKQTLISAAAVILGFAVIFVLSNFLEKSRVVLLENSAEEDLIFQGANLKGYVLGFEGLLADWYWMKSLQYIGDKILSSEQSIDLENLTALKPQLLYPYLDNAATLDPHFLSVYEYGATVLPAVNREDAIKLTQKGIDNNPQNWRLYQYLGFIYWRLENFEKAAEVYEKGSQINGAPHFKKLMAAKMKTDGGKRETAREIYSQMFEESQDKQIKENAALRLLELDSLDEREVYETALREFQKNNNRCANDWSEILPLVKKVKLSGGKSLRVDKTNNPVDPRGAPYILDKQNCVVTFGENAARIPSK